MEGGPPGFPQAFAWLVVLRMPAHDTRMIATGLSPALVGRSSPFALARVICCWSYNPARLLPAARFGLLPVRSPLLRESRLISFRRATEMFQFTHCPPSLPMCSAGGLQTSLWRGCPIRTLRAHRLHAAPPERFAGLRVLLRPSAPRHPPRTLCSLFASTRSRDLGILHSAMDCEIHSGVLWHTYFG